MQEISMSNIAKISVEKHDSKEQFLYDLDKSKSLCEVVRDICKTTGLPESPVYGLKLIQTKENPFINTYISDKTYKDIQHSDCLKIAFSIEYLLNKRILPHINEKEDSFERAISFEDLLKLSVDPVFIEELVKSESHKQLIEVYINNPLKTNEELALLITICHLFQKGNITETSQDILTKTISIIKNPENTTDQIKYALSILHKILIHKDSLFIPWKEKNLNTEHELYVLQTYLLSLYKEALNSEINLNENNLFKKEEFELCEYDVRRLTVLMDFDENDNYSNKFVSMENLVQYNRDERKKKDDELKHLLKNNPCIQELKKVYTKQNEENKTNGSIFVQLSKNERELYIYDITNVKTNEMSLEQKIVISDITHIVIGKNCKHSNLCKHPSQAFSIVINHSENQINFIAKDEKTACNKRRSVYYKKELDDLVDMDIMLQILELQNVPIPKHPPPVPPPPRQTKPPLPPKTEAVLRHMRKREKY
ncbi:hypothetical protein NQ314_012568 [Rhamnusium bicolor]|uniref:PH domain-containing protein n=1 Tax=Rhamnusium bicolor TaxID=1586634 RepID=A0AAV8XBW4_9CUCU|nr:hypothetical protein NQ314_012568 [Rhamnusium bicolor]